MAQGDLKTYAKDEVIVTFGSHQVQGFADGDTITCVRDGRNWSMAPGDDGEVTRSKLVAKHGRVTLVLKASSDSNDVLSGIAELDYRTGAGVLPLSVRDLSGRSLHFCENAFIEGIPDAAYAQEAGSREWVILCPNLNGFIGGNT